MKRKRKTLNLVIALLLVFALSFPMGINANAIDGNQPPDQVLQTTQSTDQSTESAVQLSEPSLQTTVPAIQTIAPTVQTTVPAITTSPDAILKEELTTAPTIKPIELSKELTIEKVQVVNGGEVQAKHRNSITKSDDGKYYTNSRSASMTDARIFTVNTTVSYGDLGITKFSEFDTTKLSWTYGGKPLSDWKKYNAKAKSFSGDQAVSLVNNSLKTVDNKSEKTITITGDIFFDAFYSELKNEDNIPYAGYSATTKGGYPDFAKGNILGTYSLSLNYQIKNIPTAVSSKDSISVTVASNKIKLNLYDSFHTWAEIDQIAKDLQEKSDKSNNVINGRYVSVGAIGKSSAGRNIWNVVIAKDENSVEDYLNNTKLLMEKDPSKLTEEISKHKIPLYFNNVHPDETPASDAIIELVDTFIYQNNDLSFETQTDAKHVDKTKDSNGKPVNGYTIEGDKNETKKVSFKVDEILDNFILVFNFTENPDGRANLVRTNEYGFDLNRDAAYQTQPEAVALTSNIVKWDPLSMVEFHGYVKQLLIEPCTGPHDPNYEYDLYADRMLEQGNTLGKAMIGNTGYRQYLVPATDYSDGWDDGAPVYGPMFAMLYGVMGYTLEIPHATQDSKDACFTAGLALVKDCLDHKEDYYQNKLEYKQRGIENKDEKEKVDKFFKDPYTNKILGRPRVEGQSFFPEYYVIPVHKDYQKNPLEAYKMLQFLDRNGADIDITTKEIKYKDKILPEGTYVIDMHQANRGFVNSMLSDGYDASNFADIYAELVISYPDMRNFDCITIYENDIYENDIFDGSIIGPDGIEAPITNISGTSEKVVIQNNNIDVIKLVNRLLKSDKSVQMLTKDYGNAKKGDFIIDREDLGKHVDGLLVFGSELEGTPQNIKTIIKPNINVIGSTTYSKYVLDLLEFTDTYNYISDAKDISSNANIIVDFDEGSDVTKEIKDKEIGYIGIGTSALDFIQSSKLLPGFICTIPGADYNEGLVKSAYSNSSLITSNYDKTDASYIMNGTIITSLPADGSSLITINSDKDFFKAGWFPNHDILKGKTLAVTGYTGSNNDVPITLFANNIFSKAHAQHTFNMFANAIYLSVSDIELDNIDKPVITATPSSEANLVSSSKVSLKYVADRIGTEGGTLKAMKYKITSSSSEPLYTDGAGWLDYTNATAISLSAKGEYYIHAYASNSINENTQKVFGPYKIEGTSSNNNNGSGHSHSSSNKSILPTTPAAIAPTPAAITPTPAAFSDIQKHWAASSIKFVTDKKLFDGVSKDKFAPDATMTRGMLVTVLGRAYGVNVSDYNKKSTFIDVPESAYYAPYVVWASEKGMIKGSGNDKFLPNQAVKRGEMAVIIANYMKFIGKDTDISSTTLNYTDNASIPSWAINGVKLVTHKGLMTGTSGNRFDFNGLSTRAQVATVLERMLKLP